MPIIDPIPPTPLELQVRSAKNRIQQQYESLVRCLKEIGDMVWKNTLKKTPQEVVAAFGTDAVQLFQISGLVRQLIQTVSGQEPPPTMPAGWGFTANPDGTVTLVPPA
jgi:hypothetical protein